MTAVCAWIAGASGLVGNELLHLLLDDARVAQVVSLGRREFKFTHSKMLQRIVDFAALPADLPAPDVAFCALGTTIRTAGSREAFRRVDYDHSIAFAGAALAAGATRFAMVSSISADCESGNFYLRTKGEAEHAISMLPFAAVHIARPSMLLGKRREFRLGERIATPLFYLAWPLLLGPLRKYRAIHARRVAKAMLECALGPTQGVHIHESDELARMGRSTARRIGTNSPT